MPKKVLKGIVISNKPNKTITVQVERKYSHPILKKVVKKRKKYNVHDETNKYKNEALIIEVNEARIGTSKINAAANKHTPISIMPITI